MDGSCSQTQSVLGQAANTDIVNHDDSSGSSDSSEPDENSESSDESNKEDEPTSPGSKA